MADVEDAAVAAFVEEGLDPNGQSQAKDTDQHPTTAVNESNQTDSQYMSKNQRKKLKRKQIWEQGRESRKARRKEKTKERKARQRLAIQQGPADHRAAGLQPGPHSLAGYSNWKERKKQYRSELVPVTFVYDCGFDDLMHDTERISLAAQLTRAYSDNRKAKYSARMVVSSFNGELKQRFEGILQQAHRQWKGVYFTDDDFLQAAQAAAQALRNEHAHVAGLKTAGNLDHFYHCRRTGEISAGQNAQLEESSTETDTNEAAVRAQLYEEAETVYLTSDSPYTLDRLKPFSTYIIGGLVDKNRHKGLCYKRACDRGVKTAKLPIGEYMRMASRQVLATNHVGEIMLKWLEFGDWGVAFDSVIPKRKGGVLKERDGNDVVVVDANDSQEQDGHSEAHEDDSGNESAGEGVSVEETKEDQDHVQDHAADGGVALTS